MTERTYSANDFLDADIHISHIQDIWYSKTATWAIPEKVTRKHDGLLLFLSGGIEYYFENITFRALPGQLVRLPKGIPYNGIKLDDEPNEFFCIDFLTEKEGKYASLPLPFSFAPQDFEHTLSLFKRLTEIWQGHSFGRIPECRGRLLSLIADLVKDYAENACGYGKSSRITSFCNWIDRNSDNAELTIEDIASHFHFSATHLRRLFTKELGMTPSEYLLKLRLDKAKRLLISEWEKQVGQIAAECGFSSLYYFSNCFSSKVGCSPSEYRKLKRK